MLSVETTKFHVGRTKRRNRGQCQHAIKAVGEQTGPAY